MSHDLEVANIWIFRIFRSGQKYALLNVSWTSEGWLTWEIALVSVSSALEEQKETFFGNRNCADIWSTFAHFGHLPNGHDLFYTKVKYDWLKVCSYSWKYFLVIYQSAQTKWHINDITWVMSILNVKYLSSDRVRILDFWPWLSHVKSQLEINKHPKL